MKHILKRILAAICCLSVLAAGSCKPAATETEGPFPVIIIPGVIGTELVKNGRTVWPVTVGDSPVGILTAVTDFLSLGLDDTAQSDGSITPVRLSPMTEYTGENNVGTYGVYTKLAVTLSEEIGYENVWFFGYDWRLDNRQTAEELSAYISQVLETTGAKKVTVVAHSMGGLVTSAYLAAHGEEKLVDRAVTLGTPFLGAENAYATLTAGAGFFDFNEETWGEFMPSLRGMFRSMPSLWQLMPGSGWEKQELVTDGALAEDASQAQKTGYEFYTDVTSRITELWSGVEHVNIVGRGYSTAGEQGSEDGDGTVTLYSATADGGFEGSVLDLSHNDLVTDDASLELVKEAVSRP